MVVIAEALAQDADMCCMSNDHYVLHMAHAQYARLPNPIRRQTMPRVAAIKGVLCGRSRRVIGDENCESVSQSFRNRNTGVG